MVLKAQSTTEDYIRAKREREGERERESDKERELVSWCFKPSQPQRITSGLVLHSENFMMYIVDEVKSVCIRSMVCEI